MDLVPILPRARLWRSKADFFRPFRPGAADAGENITPLFDPDVHRTEPEEADLQDLNGALAVLVDVFPDVEPEVFREMLLSISTESRLAVVTENLINKKAKWVQGRYRTPQDLSKRAGRHMGAIRDAECVIPIVPDEETFRGDVYKKAVKQVFYQEFRSLSHSSIKAVLAEQNFNYALSRPILQQLSTRKWRFSLSNFWSKRSPSSAAAEHPFIIWQPVGSDTQPTPAVKRTGSAKLDRELYDLFVGPVHENQRQAQLVADRKLALQLNESEAEEVEALFDCECCYSSVTFEQVTTCDDGCHQLCFDCVRRTVSEALFGQGWSRTVDLGRSTVRCFAPTTMLCEGTIPSSTLRRALANDMEKEDIWNEFQERVASEILVKSGLSLQRCPFCNYVEVDDVPPPHRRKAMAIWTHVIKKTSNIAQVILLAILIASLVLTIPFLLLFSFAYILIQIYLPAKRTLHRSWTRIYTRRRGLKFYCLNPSCSRTTCTRCLTPWRDPHTCFESEKTSLRTFIETRATAAIKRTCPKCLLSFVKSSGCNKLVCNCGYTMCYICRQEITAREGYGHFCQHFRPSGGRCVECERCDLYGDEDEEGAIREAAERAEREWRVQEEGREGEVDDCDGRKARAMVRAVVEGGRVGSRWESWLDGVVDAVYV